MNCQYVNEMLSQSLRVRIAETVSALRKSVGREF